MTETAIVGSHSGLVRSPRIEVANPYDWLDATYLKVRENGRLVSMAVVIAIGVKGSEEREVLGWDIGPSEKKAFWPQFLVVSPHPCQSLVAYDRQPGPIAGCLGHR